ncbi:MAG TPA: PaaI family thioesterase [Candidatus Dormibacteraeota bacterium]|nr:PaaI family thioesterase [Candidatus Dormibacteraeota bacterium]
MTDRSATELMHEAMPLCATLGARVVTYTPAEVAFSLDWAPGLCTIGGILHGGVIMALADSAGGACALLNLPKEASGTATIESKTNFLGAVRSGTVTATAAPLHVGGTTIVVETSVRDSSGRMVAKVTQTQMVLRPRR